MPVHAAGPRLYRSIKFEHLAKGAGGKRAANIHLNLTPFVDMMTILVTFLLMVFSATGEILQAQKGLELPVALQKSQLQQAPIIVIGPNEISVIIQEDKAAMPITRQVATIQSLLDNPPASLKIDALHEIMKATYDSIRNNVAADRGYGKDLLEACKREQSGLPPIERDGQKVICPDGLAIVQADKNTDARIINMVINTARMAGFEKLLFAVKYGEE